MSWSDALATNLAVFLHPGLITFSALQLNRPLLDIVEAAAVPCGSHHQVPGGISLVPICVPQGGAESASLFSKSETLARPRERQHLGLYLIWWSSSSGGSLASLSSQAQM